MPVSRLAYAVLSYLLFFATFLYLALFVTGLYLPHTVDSGPTGSTPVAVIVNLALIALFGVQHSLMARPAFKQALTRYIHPSVERSTYVLATVVALWILFALWQPIPGVVWATSGTLAIVLWALCALGWTVVFLATWMLDHFHLFGLRQAWEGFSGKPPSASRFREPLFYRFVRHPLYFGFLFAFWSIPTMTYGHLLFAGGMTVYILIAVRYEEKDLLHELGDRYADYRRRVGMLLPGIGKAR